MSVAVARPPTSPPTRTAAGEDTEAGRAADTAKKRAPSLTVGGGDSVARPDADAPVLVVVGDRPDARVVLECPAALVVVRCEPLAALVVDVDAPPERAVVGVAAGAVVGVGALPLQRVPVPSRVTIGCSGALLSPAVVSIQPTASCSVPLQATPMPSLVALGAINRARCGGECIHQIVEPLLP
jgi:hypothetical protein